MAFDFSKLGKPEKARAPIDPIKIFESLPSLAGTPNDLWRGQYEALAEWHIVRKNSDVLISLNTGAGKTIISCDFAIRCSPLSRICGGAYPLSALSLLAMNRKRRIGILKLFLIGLLTECLSRRFRGAEVMDVPFRG
jgi:hypothetical protein